MHCRLQEGHRRKIDMAKLNTPLIGHFSITIVLSQSLVSLVFGIMHPTRSFVHSTGSLKASPEKDQRAIYLSIRPMDPPATIHPPNSPFHPCTPTFSHVFPSLHRKHKNSVSFVFKKKIMMNKTTSFFTYFLPDVLQLVLLSFRTFCSCLFSPCSSIN